MSTRFTCDDGETLVAYLYGEIDTALGADVAAHVATCARCSDEIAALGGVRQTLAQWTPPAPPLRFTLVSEVEASKVVRPHVPAWQAVPRWAQAVAATLALAAGASVANLQVRHDADGWTVTTGWMAAAPTSARLDDDTRRTLATLQQQVQALAERPAPVPAAVTASAAPVDGVALARMNAMIEASEKRQQQELAVRLTQFGQDFDIQRRADLMRMEQGLGQLEGRTRAVVNEQGEMLNLLVRTGLRPPQ